MKDACRDRRRRNQNNTRSAGFPAGKAPACPERRRRGCHL